MTQARASIIYIIQLEFVLDLDAIGAVANIVRGAMQWSKW